MLILNTETKKRDEYWDVIKGIGIISIILGHSCRFSVKWVYSYHLVIFFFVAGYFYSERKYLNAPFEYIGKKIGGLWPKFVLYQSILVLLSNLFISIGILDIPKSDFDELIVSVLNTMFFQHSYIGASAWFVLALITTSSVFCIIFCVVYKCKSLSFFRRRDVWLALLVLILSVCGGIGTWCCIKGYRLKCYGELALLLQPIIGSGWLIKELGDNVKKRFSKKILKIVCLIGIFSACAIIGWIVGVKDQLIDLSAHMIIGPISFYLVSFAGIYLCMCIAKMIMVSYRFRKIISFVGRCSYEIMVFHILAFKLIDLFYTKIISYYNISGENWGGGRYCRNFRIVTHIYGLCI